MTRTHTTSSLLVFPFLAAAFWACNRPATPPDFQVEPGFNIIRVASEPLIKDPVDLEFNERGDAMVLEMPGYPFEDKQSSILILKDNDGDGMYDDKIVFIDSLLLADSFMPYQKGVLVAAPPYLLFVHDDNMDYRPEQVDTLMGGFATGNLQHNYNGLTMGPDGWIYAANGGNDGSPYWWNDTTTRLDLRGQDFRFHIGSRKLERLGESSGGFGLALNHFGDVFETHNLEHVSHLVFPDRYLKGRQIVPGHTLTNISDHEENGLARIYPVGEQETRVNHPEQSGYFSGACGIAFYGDAAFGTEYENSIWVADVVLNLIHVDKLSPSGSSFSASRVLQQRDFAASTDRSFRPVNMTVAPDGSIYVVDMYRKVIEHPEWIPDDIEKTLDMNAGKDEGRIYRIEKPGAHSKIDFSKFQSPSGLMDALVHTNQWVRRTAHRLALEQNQDAAWYEALHHRFGKASDYGKVNLLWLLSVKGMLHKELLTTALEDASAHVRESAIRIAEEEWKKNPELISRIGSMLLDTASRVRMQAALSLSLLTGNERLPHRETLSAQWKKSALMNRDQWNVAALTLAAGDDAVYFFEMMAQTDEPPRDVLLSIARAVASQSGDHIERILAQLTKVPFDDELTAQVVHELSNGINSSASRSMLPMCETLERRSEGGLLTELALFRQKAGFPPSSKFISFSQRALSVISDRNQPDSVRLSQMNLIRLLPYSAKAEVLFACLNTTEPMQVQEEAMRQLAAFKEKEIGVRLVSVWSTLSPQVRRYASDLLLYIEVHHDALLTGLEQGQINIGEMNFDLERRRMLLSWTDDTQIQKRAEKLFRDSGVVNRQAAMDGMKQALTLKGVASDGAKVFETICSNCHRFGQIGKEVGPVLSEIGRKSKETLMHDILDPNAAVDPMYINHRVETKDGEVHIGIVSVETDEQLVIRKIGGSEVTVKKSALKSFRSLGSSLMMEGLEQSMTVQEMANLLAFLQQGV